MKTTEYRFLRTHAGVTSFASVTIAIRQRLATDIAAIEESLIENVSDGDVAAIHEPSWIEAARRGIQRALDYIALTSPTDDVIVIKRIQGTATDTTPDSVECAAFLATHKALLPDCDLPPVSNTRPWTIVCM